MRAAQHAAMDKCRRRRRSAHVEGDEVRLAQDGGKAFGAHGAGRAAGRDEEHRFALRGGGGREPAIGIADQQRSRHAGRAQFAFETIEIAAQRAAAHRR